MPQKRLAAGVLPALACAALMTLSAKSDEPAPASAGHREYFRGMSDASAGVMLGTNCFAAGNDGDNRICIYRLDSPGRPVDSFDCSGFLRVFGKNLETDPEGAARMGGRIFWIGSHGANQHGHFAPNRRRCARPGASQFVATHARTITRSTGSLSPARGENSPKENFAR